MYFKNMKSSISGISRFVLVDNKEWRKLLELAR